jgi:hypothetical protein
MIVCAIAIDTFRSTCGACAWAIDEISAAVAAMEKVLNASIGGSLPMSLGLGL